MRIVPVAEIPKAELVTDFSVEKLNKLWLLFREMSIICLNRDGIGLHAVQVGIPVEMFVVRHSSTLSCRRDFFDYFFNCYYGPVGEERLNSIEGCLSLDVKTISLDGAAGPTFRRRFFEVPRWKKVHVKGFKLVQEHGNSIKEEVDFEPDGIYNSIFQHELDHGKGMLISDIGKEIHIYRGN